MTEKKDIRFSLGLKFSLVIILMIALIATLIVFLGYQNYTRQIINRYRQANVALINSMSEIIDWDKVDFYARTRVPDDAYAQCLDGLRLCARAGDAKYIYIFKPTEGGCTFIFDTEEGENQHRLGDTLDWERFSGGYRQDMIDGKEIEVDLEDVADYGWLLTFYTPFSDSRGNFVGYVGVDYSAAQLRVEQAEFITQLAIAALVVSFVITVVLVLILNFVIIRPVNKIASAANSYLVNTSEAFSVKNSITRLNVKTKDELEDLASSLKNMEGKIQNYLKNLEAITHRAENDSMTNLLNREAFEKRVKWILKNDSSHGLFVFMMVDIDNFKSINDNWGHSVGDDAIIACAQVIKSRFRPGDLIARMGGDEFAVFYKTPESLQAIERRVASINLAVHALHILDEVELTVSIGVVTLDATLAYDYQEFYIAADSVLYEAKTQGRNGYVIESSLEE